MHKGARDDPTLSFEKLRKFLFSSSTLVSFFVSSVRIHKFIKYNIKYNPICDFVMGRLCFVPSGFGCLSCQFTGSPYIHVCPLFVFIWSSDTIFWSLFSRLTALLDFFDKDSRACFLNSVFDCSPLRNSKNFQIFGCASCSEVQKFCAS